MKDLILDSSAIQALESLKNHPGWKIFVERVLPHRVMMVERRMSHYEYENLGQVWADQAVVRTLESLPRILDETIQSQLRAGDDDRNRR